MKLLFKISLLVLLIAGTAFTFSDEILTKLGIYDPRYMIMRDMVELYKEPGCSGGCQYLQMPHPKNLASIISGDKKALALESAQWVKDYVQSAEFNEKYQAFRDNQRPKNEQRQELDQEGIKSMEATIKSTKESIKNATHPEERKAYVEMLPNLEYSLAQSRQEYPQTWKFDQKYPVSTDSLVMRTLRIYLKELSTVDFAAQLKTQGRYKVFVNQEYERKLPTWKAMYRAGKDVNDVVKKFVMDWMKEGVNVSKAPVKKTDAKTSQAGTEKSSSASTATTGTAARNTDATAATEAATDSTESGSGKKSGLKEGLKKKGALLKKIKSAVD